MPIDASARRLPSLLFFLAVLFFLSGTSALIYQMLWLRLLGLVFGVTVYAASTVWAVFMAGLAAGSFLGGRTADRVARPLIWLGIAEAFIGATALATPIALDALQRAYAGVHPSLNSSFITLTAVRLAMSFAVLIVPSALMGATLPLVIKSSLLSAEGLGDRVGVLYATNTAGAIAGSLVAGLYLIPQLGIRGAFFVAAALNAGVAIAAIAGGMRTSPAFASADHGRATARPVQEDHATHEMGGPADLGTRGLAALRVVLIVFAGSGFVSLALEVVWFRIVTLFLRPTVYGYAMMLAAVLGGIAIGSYVAAPMLRRAPRRDWIVPLAWLEGAIAILSLLSFFALPAIPRIMAAAGPAVSSLIGDYLAYQAIVSIVVIAPTMLMFGVAFPIGLHVWASGSAILPPDAHQTGTRVGQFYSLNVTGAIIGSVATGFVLLPRFGSLATLIGVAAMSLISAFALLAVAPSSLTVRTASAVLIAATFAITAPATPDPFDAFLAQRYAGQTIVWQREAVQVTVSVHQERGGTYTLNTNGNHQASSSGAMPRVHQRIGNLPMIVHRDARDALVIGLGGGATAGALSQHTGVSVDIVELSHEVTQAADRFFRSINFSVLRKPTVHVHVDDGRNFLLLTDKRYDVITADVILPIHAGSGNLYSAEYFTLAKRALKPGGFVMQWVAGTEAEYKLIMRTFLSVFTETTLWADGSLMLGSADPLQLRREDFEWKQAVPKRREMMATLGVTSFEDLLRLYVAGPQELRQYVGDGPILTDDRPLVEYFLSLPRDRQVDLSGVKGDVLRHVVRP